MSKVYDYVLEMAELEQETGWLEMDILTEKDIEQYYLENQEEFETVWEEYLYEKDWGSGEDRIKPTDEMFWEFVEEQLERNQC